MDKIKLPYVIRTNLEINNEYLDFKDFDKLIFMMIQ
jgi:hypothetical protein